MHRTSKISPLSNPYFGRHHYFILLSTSKVSHFRPISTTIKFRNAKEIYDYERQRVVLPSPQFHITRNQHHATVCPIAATSISKMFRSGRLAHSHSKPFSRSHRRHEKKKATTTLSYSFYLCGNKSHREKGQKLKKQQHEKPRGMK